MMKAIVKSKAAPGLSYETVPIPVIRENEVLIKVHKTAICGTDIHIYKWDRWASHDMTPPVIIGHEFSGEICATGPHVQHFKVGQRVSGEGHITCGICQHCLEGNRHLCINTIGIGRHRNGCFAEYVALPEENVFLLPDTVSDEIGTILDPFGNAVHTALAFELVTEDVLITGAGPIGCMAAAIAKKAGARNVVVTDFNPMRLQLATTMGATAVVNLSEHSLEEKLKEIGIEGFGVALEVSGSPDALRSTLHFLHHGGKLALLGIIPQEAAIDWNQIIFKMLSLKGIYGREIFRTWHQMTALLESGLDLRPMLTHKFPAEDFEKGFAAMTSGESGKVLLDWNLKH